MVVTIGSYACVENVYTISTQSFGALGASHVSKVKRQNALPARCLAVCRRLSQVRSVAVWAMFWVAYDTVL